MVCRSSTSGRKKVSRVVLRDWSRAKRRRRLSRGTPATEHRGQEWPINKGGEGREEKEESCTYSRGRRPGGQLCPPSPSTPRGGAAAQG